MILGRTNSPRNDDSPRAAAILYGDWGTSKAYVMRRLTSSQKSRESRSDELIAGQKALKQTLRVTLKAVFEIRKSWQAV